MRLYLFLAALALCWLNPHPALTLASGPAQPLGTANANVHAFFYCWYGNPETDGNFLHWNHEILPHWNEATRARFPHGPDTRHDAGAGIVHAPYYPARGTYSSSDPATLDSQMSELSRAGVGTIVLSWWGQASREGTSDTQGVQTDNIIATVISAVERSEGLKFSVHLEPYPGRTHDTVKEDVEYLVDRFGESNAWLRLGGGRRVFYVYDSYHIEASDWNSILGSGKRDGALKDGFFIALWLERNGGSLAVQGGFDGVYTYFASDGFVYGSTTRNWKSMREYCDRNSLTFIASVGPGYNDEGIRPWNSHNTKSREDGGYYDRMWEAAIDSGTHFVSITSYNEWGEGTQIESAASIEKAPQSKQYLEYPGGNEGFYIEKTRYWVDRFSVVNNVSSEL